MASGSFTTSQSETRVLLVEDNPGDVHLIRTMLAGLDQHHINIRETNSLKGALHLGKNEAFDALLLDLSLPDSGGLETVERAHSELGHLPIIVMTGTNDDDLAIRAVQVGAQDYIRKGDTDGLSLMRCIRYAVERKRAEQLLEERNVALQESNDHLRQLTFALTHDLQTPLASMTGAVDAFRRGMNGNLEEESKRWLERIETSAARMARMLDELMMFARANNEPLKCGSLCIQSLVHEVVQELATTELGSSATITANVAAQQVWADRDGLFRVLQNAMTNAIKHNDTAKRPTVRINASVRMDRVRIFVADNGPGIPEHQLERVFLPFARISATTIGTGLGLTITRSHVERMGGRVWLESDGRTGATMVIELTLAPSNASSRPCTADAQELVTAA